MIIKKKKRQIRNTLKVKKLNISNKPILYVFKSNKNIYGQIIKDGLVLTSFSSKSKDFRNTPKMPGVEVAKEVGKMLAKEALKNNISEVVFNKGCYTYFGRVKAFADGAREGKLKF